MNTVRYTAILDDGETLEWDIEVPFTVREKPDGPGNMLISQKTAAIVHKGCFYPLHRIRQITWRDV